MSGTVAERKEALRNLVNQLLVTAVSLDRLLKLGGTDEDAQDVAADVAECYSLIELGAGEIDSWSPGQAAIEWQMDFPGGDCPKDGCEHCEYRLECIALHNVP